MSGMLELQGFQRLKSDDDLSPPVRAGVSQSGSIGIGRESLRGSSSSNSSNSSSNEHDHSHESSVMIADDEEGKEEYRPHSRPHDPPQTDAHGNIIVATNIHKTYLLGVEGVPALRGVSLSIKRGEFITILGSSGGGKTSMLNILGTIDRPTKGELFLCGHRITSNTTDEEFAELRLKKIGFVFQSFNLIPSMTALENVALPMSLEGRLSPSEVDARARDLLERVGLGDRVDHLPSQMSGGEAQRTTIARAIANRPSVLLLDEPTGDLDTVNSLLILSLLLHLNRSEQMTCVMVTHDTALKAYAHRVCHMVDGKLARLEHIDATARAHMDAELAQKVSQIRGEWSGAIVPREQPTTEYREATDYESFLLPDEDE